MIKAASSTTFSVVSSLVEERYENGTTLGSVGVLASCEMLCLLLEAEIEDAVRRLSLLLLSGMVGIARLRGGRIPTTGFCVTGMKLAAGAGESTNKVWLRG